MNTRMERLLKVNIGRTKNHIDHKFSVKEGYVNGIDPKIIGSKFNLESIPHKENCSKKEKCSITEEELVNLCKTYHKQ